MIDMAIDARPADLGNGFAVRRVLPYRHRRMVGPFIFLDHGGPIDLPAERRREADVLPHPHIGLATVSYLFRGRLTHRDSLGSHQVIAPGDVNWMHAGRGIAHSERLEDGEEPLELIQSWVAVPDADEETEPTFEHVPVDALPIARERDRWLRVIAGSGFGMTSPVATRSPMFYIHAELDAGAPIELPAGYAERAAYVARGEISVGGDRHGAGRMLVFSSGAAPRLDAVVPSTVMLLGGEPVGPRHIWWNFVSSRKERIEQAKSDWRDGRIALPPDDDREWVALPR